MNSFEPKILAFVCNWCSYAGADKAGGQKLKYPPNIKLLRVMCSGRIDVQHVMDAYTKGADAVMVLACHPGDCHYRNGNIKAMRRFEIFKNMLEQFGIDKKRFLLDWVAAGESLKFQDLSNKITKTVKELGPLKLKGMVESEPK